MLIDIANKPKLTYFEARTYAILSIYNLNLKMNIQKDVHSFTKIWELNESVVRSSTFI